MALTSHGHHIPSTRTIDNPQGVKKKNCGSVDGCKVCFDEAYRDGRQPPSNLEGPK